MGRRPSRLRDDESDLKSVWGTVNNGTITVISSDHAPSVCDSALWKRKSVVEAQTTNLVPTFAQIPKGLPGIEPDCQSCSLL